MDSNTEQYHLLSKKTDDREKETQDNSQEKSREKHLAQIEKIPMLIDSILLSADERAVEDFCDLLRIIAGCEAHAAHTAGWALTKAFVYHPEFKQAFDEYVRKGGYDYTRVVG